MTPIMVLAMVVALIEKQRAQAFRDSLNDALGDIFATSDAQLSEILGVLSRAGFPTSYLAPLRSELQEGILNDDTEDHPHWHRWTMYEVDPRPTPLHSGRVTQEASRLEAELMRCFGAAGMTFAWSERVTADLVEAFLHRDLQPRWLTHSPWALERDRVRALLQTHGVPAAQALAWTDMSMDDLQSLQPGSPELARELALIEAAAH